MRAHGQRRRQNAEAKDGSEISEDPVTARYPEQEVASANNSATSKADVNSNQDVTESAPTVEQVQKVQADALTDVINDPKNEVQQNLPFDEPNIAEAKVEEAKAEETKAEETKAEAATVKAVTPAEEVTTSAETVISEENLSVTSETKAQATVTDNNTVDTTTEAVAEQPTTVEVSSDETKVEDSAKVEPEVCLLYTSPSPRDS